MGKPRFTEEFKKEAIGQVLERGYSVKEVAERLGVSAYGVKVPCMFSQIVHAIQTASQRQGHLREEVSEGSLMSKTGNRCTRM